MSKLRIHVLSLAPMSAALRQRIENLGNLVYNDAVLDDPHEASKCWAADIMIVTPRLRQNIVEVLERCQLISVQAVGTDSIDIASATRKGIVVCNVPSQMTAQAVAEHAFALLLSLAKRLDLGKKVLQASSWRTGVAYRTLGLAGKTLGVVGFGRVGQCVATIAQGFQLRVLACETDPQRTTCGDAVTRFTELEELLQDSDFVVLAVPATPATEGMICSSTLAKMKHTALLINIARGKLVVEDDLVAALREGKIAGAATDVFANEPPSPSHPLLSVENVVVSAHVAGSTEEAISYLLEQSVTNVEAFLGSCPVNVVNPEVLTSRK